MKRIFKNPIFMYILGFVTAIGITLVLAYSYLAQDVGFTPKETSWKQNDGSAITNVKEAIDDLKEEFKMVEDELGGKHVESGYINISFTHSWRYQTITFEKPFINPPTIRYNYNAGTSGGSVYATDITTTSFQLGYNSFFSVLHSDTIYWIAYGE